MKRRGNPLEKTAWTPETARKFIRFQSAMLAAQQIQPDRIGGLAYELPSRMWSCSTFRTKSCQGPTVFAAQHAVTFPQFFYWIHLLPRPATWPLVPKRELGKPLPKPAKRTKTAGPEPGVAAATCLLRGMRVTGLVTLIGMGTALIY